MADVPLCDVDSAAFARAIRVTALGQHTTTRRRSFHGRSPNSFTASPRAMWCWVMASGSARSVSRLTYTMPLPVLDRIVRHQLWPQAILGIIALCIKEVLPERQRLLIDVVLAALTNDSCGENHNVRGLNQALDERMRGFCRQVFADLQALDNVKSIRRLHDLSEICGQEVRWIGHQAIPLNIVAIHAQHRFNTGLFSIRRAKRHGRSQSLRHS